MLSGYSTIQWIFLALGMTFPGWGIAAKYSRLNSGATAVEVLICSIIVSLLYTVLFAGALFAAGVWHPAIFQLGLFGLSSASFLLFKGTDLFRALARVPSSVLTVLLAVLLNSLTWGPPSEWISYNYYDSGRYSNLAGFMLQSGGIKVGHSLEELGALEPSDYSYPKYYFDDPQMPKFELPYLHLFPASMAIARSYFGLGHSLRINQFLSFTGLLIFFALLRKFGISTLWSCLGMLLLGSNPAFVFYANRTMGEMLALNLVLAGFYFLSICEEYGSKLFGFLSALSMFALATCRLEYGAIYSLIVLIPILTKLLYFQPLKTGTKSFFVSAALLLVPLGWYYISYCNFYIYRNVVTRIDDFLNFLHLTWKPDVNFPAAALLIAINSIIIALGMWIIRSVGEQDSSSEQHLKHSRVFNRYIPIAVTSFLLYAWFLRPLLALQPAGHSAVWDYNRQLSLPRLLYFIDPISVFSIALCTILSIKNRSTSNVLFATLISLLVGIINNYHSDATLGWVRRFIPLVIPGCYISLIILLSSRKRIGLLILSPILVFNLTSTFNSVFTVRENQGSIKAYQSIKESLGNNPTVLSFDGRMASSIVVPLHSQLGVPSIYLSRGLNLKKMVTIQRLLSAQKDVYVIHTGSGAESEFENLVKEFSNYGYFLEKHLSRVFSLKAFDHFCEEWHPNKNFASLFLPPGFYGLCPRYITFPVSIWKVGVLTLAKKDNLEFESK